MGIKLQMVGGLMAGALALGGCGPESSLGPLVGSDQYNVVLVTFDGVRREDFLQRFPLFWERLAPRGQVYGNPEERSEMTVANISNASLPGYTSIFADEPQSCLTNHCSRIAVPTFLDRLHDERGLAPRQLAVFASWSKMALAVTGRDDVAWVRAGRVEPDVYQRFAQPALLEAAYEFDQGTVLNGLRFLREERPRFLFLSLLDSDRFAHQRQRQRYLQTLDAYDRMLSTLVELLERSGAYGQNTALLVTTDHGRGEGELWSEHGPHLASSGQVWAFAMLPPSAQELQLVPARDRAFTHHDIRYTIQTLFGQSTRGSRGFVQAEAARSEGRR